MASPGDQLVPATFSSNSNRMTIPFPPPLHMPPPVISGPPTNMPTPMIIMHPSQNVAVMRHMFVPQNRMLPNTFVVPPHANAAISYPTGAYSCSPIHPEYASALLQAARHMPTSLDDDAYENEPSIYSMPSSTSGMILAASNLASQACNFMGPPQYYTAPSPYNGFPPPSSYFISTSQQCAIPVSSAGIPVPEGTIPYPACDIREPLQYYTAPSFKQIHHTHKGFPPTSYVGASQQYASPAVGIPVQPIDIPIPTTGMPFPTSTVRFPTITGPMQYYNPTPHFGASPKYVSSLPQYRLASPLIGKSRLFHPDSVKHPLPPHLCGPSTSKNELDHHPRAIDTTPPPLNATVVIQQKDSSENELTISVSSSCAQPKGSSKKNRKSNSSSKRKDSSKCKRDNSVD